MRNLDEIMRNQLNLSHHIGENFMAHYETREDEIHATLKSYIKERNTIEVMLQDLDDMHEHTPKQAKAYEELQQRYNDLDQAISEIRTHN